MISGLNPMEVGKSATKVLAYQPQINTPDEDDPDNYMMLVPASKKRPVMQILCATVAVILVIIALSIDEMSDGDVKFAEDLKSTDFLDEIDYDCGWKSFRVNKIYYEDENDESLSEGQTHWAYESFIYEYSGSLCRENDEIIDKEFCSKSAYNGKVWLGTGILGIFFYALSIPIVWYQGKGSILYVLLLGLGMLCLAIGSLNWMFNDKCEDIENWPQEDMSFDTTLGISLILVFVSIFCAIIGVLVSSIHLLSPVQQRRKEEKQQAQQPRIQSHIVQ